MASSISSERAFSSAGITICKWCNCLNADIVEALQCLKSLLQQDLMVREVSTLANKEQDLDYADDQPINQDNTAMEVVEADNELSWGAPIPDDSTPDAGDTDIDLACKVLWQVDIT